MSPTTYQDLIEVTYKPRLQSIKKKYEHVLFCVMLLSVPSFYIGLLYLTKF